MARAKLERSFRTGKCDSVTFRDIIATFRDSRLPVACAHGAGLGAGLGKGRTAQASAQAARHRSRCRSHGAGRTAQASEQGRQLKGAPWLGCRPVVARWLSFGRMEVLGAPATGLGVDGGARRARRRASSQP
jgi:hypothetical protein